MHGVRRVLVVLLLFSVSGSQHVSTQAREGVPDPPTGTTAQASAQPSSSSDSGPHCSLVDEAPQPVTNVDVELNGFVFRPLPAESSCVTFFMLNPDNGLSRLVLTQGPRIHTEMYTVDFDDTLIIARGSYVLDAVKGASLFTPGDWDRRPYWHNSYMVDTKPKGGLTYWLCWNRGRIRLGYGDKPREKLVAGWNDPDPFQVTHIGFSSQQGNTTWIGPCAAKDAPEAGVVHSPPLLGDCSPVATFARRDNNAYYAFRPTPPNKHCAVFSFMTLGTLDQNSYIQLSSAPRYQKVAYNFELSKHGVKFSKDSELFGWRAAMQQVGMYDEELWMNKKSPTFNAHPRDWETLWTCWDNGRVRLGRGSVPRQHTVAAWNDPNVLNITHIGFASDGGRARWIGPCEAVETGEQRFEGTS